MDIAPNKIDAEHYPFQATYYTIAREVLEFLKNEQPTDSICDVGAGNGRVANIALRLGYTDVFAIEIDERWRNSLSRVQKNAPDRFQFVIGDASELATNRRFDVVFLFNPMGRTKLETLIGQMKHVWVLPRTFVLINPEHDDLILEAGYEELRERTTGRHVEYRVFKRQER
jgi:16S rRNA G966 N2-methylase RsmD